MTSRVRLEELASSYGVETAYYDALGNRRVGSDEAVIATLRALGAAVDTDGGVESAIADFHRDRWGTPVAPVAVVWDEAAPSVVIRGVDAGTKLRAVLAVEGGEERVVESRASELPVVESAEIDGHHVEARKLGLGGPLPMGYHRVSIEHGTHAPATLTLIASPSRAFVREGTRAWGAFLPLYALESERSLGGGDATDLASLVRFVGELGGEMVGTLPLLATFLEEPFEYSPYAPVSRRFWNELFVDPIATREHARSAEAKRLTESDAFQAEAAALRAEPLVDYARRYALLRPALEALAETFFEDSGAESELRAFETHHPHLRDYARFRAAVEEHGSPSLFPANALENADPRRIRYHLYAQLRAGEQLGHACDEAAKLGLGLYLDMPLGVHPEGYDAYREPASFLSSLSAGAPPDALFTGGQKWGFAPMSPTGLRRSGYAYLRECLSHQMRGAGVLRIDHVMGLHRLYCIPDEMDATEGVYVHMPHEELYAVVCVESHRHQTMIVGEDLGTVPDAVREAMDRHALSRMYVLPFELRPEETMIMGAIGESSVASANTHDLPTWRGWWEGRDIDVRVEMGLTPAEDAQTEKRERKALAHTLADRLGVAREPAATLEAALGALAGSDAHLLLVNLEDLWLEGSPQNVPGTHRERPNWRRKAARRLEAICTDTEVRRILSMIDDRRKRR